jgi:hypothetical protein
MPPTAWRSSLRRPSLCFHPRVRRTPVNARPYANRSSVAPSALGFHWVKVGAALTGNDQDFRQLYKAVLACNADISDCRQ